MPRHSTARVPALRRPITLAQLPAAPSRPLRVEDDVVATYEPTRVGRIRKLRTPLDAEIVWADGLVGEVPVTYLRLAGEASS